MSKIPYAKQRFAEKVLLNHIVNWRSSLVDGYSLVCLVLGFCTKPRMPSNLPAMKARPGSFVEIAKFWLLTVSWPTERTS